MKSTCSACAARLALDDTYSHQREMGLVLVSANNTYYQGECYDADLCMGPGDMSTRSETKKCPDCGCLWHVTEDYEAGFKGHWCEPMEKDQ